MPPSHQMITGEVITDQSLAGNITFKDVEFSYPTRQDHIILKNFNLDIPAGKTVAIVGSSGNGKSTIAALLERYFDYFRFKNFFHIEFDHQLVYQII